VEKSWEGLNSQLSIMKTEASKKQLITSVVVLSLFATAFILATLITPSTLHAQQGGGGGGTNNENTNCPNYVTNAPSTNCPSITNGMSLTPMTFCVKRGDSLPDPSWTPPGPGATPGSVVTSTTETCSNITTYATNNITYSFSWHYAAPGKPTATNAGTYTSPICWGVVTSSDTNDCSPPSPNPVNLGQVTWNVIDPTVYGGQNQGSTWIPPWQLGVNDIASSIGIGSIFDLSNPQGNFYLTHNWWTKQSCCANGSSGNIKKTWDQGTVTPFHLQGSFDFNAISAFPGWIQGICSVIAANDTNSASLLGAIEALGQFSAGASTTVSANETITTVSEDDCYGCNNSPYTTGDCTFNANINDSFSSTLINTVVSITGYFSSKLDAWGVSVTPPTPATQLNIYTQDYITYSLTAYVQIGTLYTDTEHYVPTGAKHIPSDPLLETTICVSPNL